MLRGSLLRFCGGGCVLRVLFEDEVGGFKGVMVLKGTWDSFQGMQTFFLSRV